MTGRRPDTKLVPGHGTIIKRGDILPYRDMIFAVRGKVQELIAEGKSVQDVLAAKVTAPFDAKVPGGLQPAGTGTSADRFVAAVENGPLSATQFHPEKSGDAGLALLENWVRAL